ncbi:MAG TPA: acyl-ACP--UDP-N-acetylglucosamine O-acyltransferase [Nitrospinota bacterium]|nr:acyl-ACP--UDP-N-acetylglucosamine O-acyltransferase [Nitrospinota bacterium]
MSGAVHPTAVVSADAVIAPDAVIGPYAVVGEEVTLGAGTKVSAHAVIENWTTVGEGCTIGPGAVIGGAPQDLGYRGHRSSVRIGKRTVVREYVTVNRSREADGETLVGDDCYLMAYSHVGHDCVLENRVVVVNAASLGGYLLVEEGAFISAQVPVHQFVRIGRLCLIGTLSPIRKDILPYTIVEGNPARVRGLNAEGLRRRETPPQVRKTLKNALKLLLKEEASTEQAVRRIREEHGDVPEAVHLTDFIEKSKRGFYR